MSISFGLSSKPDSGNADCTLRRVRVLQVRTFKGLFQDRTFWSEVPIQVAAEREIVRYNFQQVTCSADVMSWLIFLRLKAG